MNRDSTRHTPERGRSRGNFEGGFGRMVRAARTYADECRRLAFAARRFHRANCKQKTLRGQENNGGIAMLVIGRTVRMVVVGCRIRIMVVVCPTLVMITEAKL